jgi:hypothetical protein
MRQKVKKFNNLEIAFLVAKISILATSIVGFLTLADQQAPCSKWYT